MIDFAQALGWLNKFDRSHLRPGTEIRLSQVSDGTTPLDVRDQTAAEIVGDAEGIVDECERAEIYVQMGAYWFQRVELPQAMECLKQAVDIYAGHTRHLQRQGLAHWMMGIVLERLGVNHECYLQRYNAIKAFAKLVEDAKDAKDPKDAKNPKNPKDPKNAKDAKDDRQKLKAEWYCETLDLFKIYTAVMPEDARAWLTEPFEGQPGGQLKAQTAALCEQVIKLAKTPNQRAQADEAIRQLLEAASTRPPGAERGEAYLESGLAKYQMRDFEAARYCLRMSFPQYLAPSYPYAVAHWMLGNIEWQDGQKAPAFTYWQRSIEIMNELVYKAETGKTEKIRKRQAAFLKEKRDLMRRVVSHMAAN
ncbi:MAG TPA: hypothetical protein PKM21_01605 [Anaerolineales bacterium]|nr:hypothetical protein [Anaerolineales bacterium]